jgi:hypothetical protein
VKIRLFLVLLAISTMLGCATLTGRFYPVQGPLAAQTPAPVLIAKIKGHFTPGDIFVTMPDGEVCKGRWTIVKPAQLPKGATTANAPTNAMQPVWDSIYGPGYYVSHVLGTRYYAQTAVTGNRGTTLNVEMVSQPGEREGSSNIKGVAKDSRDNIYKLVVGWE